MQKPLDNRLILLLGAAAALVFIALAAVIFNAFKSNRQQKAEAQLEAIFQDMKGKQLAFEYKTPNNKSNYYYLYLLEDGSFLGSCYEHSSGSSCSEPELQRIFKGNWGKAEHKPQDGSAEFYLEVTHYEFNGFTSYLTGSGTKTYLSSSLAKAVFQDNQDSAKLHEVVSTLFQLNSGSTETNQNNGKKFKLSKINQSVSDFVLPLYLHGCLKNHQPLGNMGILTRDMVNKMDAAAKTRLRHQILGQYRCRFEDNRALLEFYRPEALAQAEKEREDMQALRDELNKTLKEQGLENLYGEPNISMQEALIGIELLSVFLLEEPEIQTFLSPKDKQNLELLPSR